MLPSVPHDFEPRLYIERRGIPFLQKAEWEQIVSQFESRPDDVLLSAFRRSSSHVTVRLGLRSVPLTGRLLEFELQNEGWKKVAERRWESDFP